MSEYQQTLKWAVDWHRNLKDFVLEIRRQSVIEQLVVFFNFILTQVPSDGLANSVLPMLMVKAQMLRTATNNEMKME
jgi:hypothetical protein